MDVNGMVVFTKCISIACGGSMPLAFSDYARIAAENRPENIMGHLPRPAGRGHIVLGSVSTEVNSGSLLLLGSGESYTFTAAENILANLIVFDRRLFSSSYAYTLGREALAPMQALARGCELITEKDACYDEVMTTVDTIWRAAEAGESCSPLMAVAMLWQLAAQLKRRPSGGEIPWAPSGRYGTRSGWPRRSTIPISITIRKLPWRIWPGRPI